MKPKVWVFVLEEAIENDTDAFDYVFWNLAQQNPETFVYIRDEMELRQAMKLAVMKTTSDGYEPFE